MGVVLATGAAATGAGEGALSVPEPQAATKSAVARQIEAV